MTKAVFQDLVDQQIAVMKTVSYIVIACMSLIMAILYWGFGIQNILPLIILPFIIGLFLNILLLPLHKKAYFTYIILIGFSFLEVISIILVTGGIFSPLVFILVTLPGFAFYTSRKQGKIWFVICLLAILFVYNVNYFGIPPINIFSEKHHGIFLLFIVIFATILNSAYLLLVKQDVSKAHRSFSAANKALEEKSKRMENLIMLVNYSTELMCVIDIKTLTFDEVNPMFKLLLGYELSALRGESIKSLLKDEVLPLITTVTDDQVISFDGTVLCRNGDEKFCNWSAIAKNGKLFAYATTRDITK